MTQWNGSHPRARSIAVGLVLALAASGCAVTQPVAVTDKNYCPFMGDALCAQLVEAKQPSRFSSGRPFESVAYLHYVNPNAEWTKYKGVMLQPVTFWAGDDVKISSADQHMLADFFYQSLEKQLGAIFKLVDQPGPGVMRVQVALSDVTTATPVLRSISMLVPQSHVLATLRLAASGTYPFVGSAQSEAKITDSETGEVLAAAVDKRVGGGALTTAAQWKLGDAENAITDWSVQMADRLGSWTSGASRP